jgi:hypothetical protein
MGQRPDLHEILKTVLGSTNVYYQAPPSTGMAYPCIIYKTDNVDTKYAGNRPYSHQKRYLVTSIDRNPDSVTPSKIADLPTARFSSRFVVDGLNHEAYNLYF